MDPSFRAEERAWYGVLAKEGFRDIEDWEQESRPLKVWTSFYQSKDRPFENAQPAYSPMISSWPEGLFSREEDLLHHAEFDSFCESIRKHGNHSLTAVQIRQVWELHITGASCRKIGAQLNIFYVTVHRATKKLISWMKVIEDRK